MRRLAHISDLHFGNHDERIVTALSASIRQAAPHLVVVSGDLTHRGRAREFSAVQAFLGGLGAPVIAVPGNHDLPLLNLWRRFVRPLSGFCRYISADLAPFFLDPELALLGLNTARSLAVKSGRISAEQTTLITERFQKVSGAQLKVLLAHHPFVPHPSRHQRAVGGVKPALASLAQAGARVLLAGHLHVGFTADVAHYYPAIGRSMLVLQAGTAASHGRRGQPNSYNLITMDFPRLNCAVRVFDGTSFGDVDVVDYEFLAGEWRRPPSPHDCLSVCG